MKTLNYIKPWFLLVPFLIAGGCSSMPGQSESGQDLANTGPTVVNPRVVPGTVELTSSLQPMQPATVVADVKDFKSSVSDVRLQFVHVPLEVPMEHVGGTTWKATLTPRQLQMLAVSGKTAKYDANVVAKDNAGMTAVSKSPVTIAVKAPDLTKSAA